MDVEPSSGWLDDQEMSREAFEILQTEQTPLARDEGWEETMRVSDFLAVQ